MQGTFAVPGAKKQTVHKQHAVWHQAEYQSSGIVQCPDALHSFGEGN